jgi:hypothetical protein
MRLRERECEPREQQGAGADGGDLDAVRESGTRMLAAADAAIDRVLSGDSERFLSNIRQHHGE